jgi:hypothetical protein
MPTSEELKIELEHYKAKKTRAYAIAYRDADVEAKKLHPGIKVSDTLRDQIALANPQYTQSEEEYFAARKRLQKQIDVESEEAPVTEERINELMRARRLAGRTQSVFDEISQVRGFLDEVAEKLAEIHERSALGSDDGARGILSRDKEHWQIAEEVTAFLSLNISTYLRILRLAKVSGSAMEAKRIEVDIKYAEDLKDDLWRINLLAQKMVKDIL